MILGRECEFEKIKSLFDDHLKSLARPLSIYICGSPGTGKTFTVTNTIQALEKEYKFTTLYIPCVSLTKKSEFLRAVIESAVRARLCAKNAFAKAKTQSDKLKIVFSSAKKKPIVIVLDELTQEIQFNPFEWPYEYPGISLIGIGNSLDLSVRMKKFMAGTTTELMVFKPYNSKQINTILNDYLKKRNINAPSIQIELCSRKVSSLTGDIRNAFNLVDSMISSSSLEVEEMAKVNSVLEKTPEKRGVKRRAPLEDLGNITPTKNNPCDAVLSSLKKVYASPCRRTKLPMHQKVLLATLMRFVSKGLGWNVSRDHLSSAYMQICEKLSLPSVEDLDEVYDLLASQAMIGFVDNGRRISFALDYDIARDAINDDAMIAEIADVSI